MTMAAAPGVLGEDYRLGPRVPGGMSSMVQEATRVVGRDVPNRIQARASATTTDCTKNGANLCEKPEGSSSMAVPIVLGVVIPISIVIAVLLYLHRRNVKKVRMEDTMDAHKSLDFGLAMDPTRPNGKKTKRKSSFFGGEKDMFNPKPRQLSLDMNLSSPYLLPPELQTSRESLHSLARTLHQNEDPYRPVTQYAASDAASMRSYQKDGGSVYAASMIDDGRSQSRSTSAAGMRGPPPRPNRLSVGPNSLRSKSPMSPPYPNSNDGTPVPRSTSPSPPPPVKGSFPLEPTVPVIESVHEIGTAETKPNFLPTVAELQAPEPVASRLPRKGLPVSPKPPQRDPAPPAPLNHRSTTGTVDEPFIYDNPSQGLGQNSAPYPDFDLNLPSASRDAPSEQLSTSLPKLTLGGPFDDETFLPGQATTSDEQTLPNVVLPSDGSDAASNAQHEDTRGRPQHRRQSSEYPQENTTQQSALGLPQMDTRRLSVGFRPLPPDELMETEDPETRANRIRSFYKEYFDDSKPDMAEYNQHYPPQGVPAEWRQGGGGPNNRGPNRGPGGGQYYEDYDPAYAGGGETNAYFDPQSNSFVMPYAQPVTRRAMTPPPSGSRMPGGRARGGPRKFHGSMGGMSMPGGPGTSRPGSSMSNGFGPRPGSSVSNMGGGRGRRPLPPPEDLVTLPTPSKLKDDTFALMGAIEFAPPPSFRDQTTGRSQSPLGERRPYQLNVPVSTPLVSSFDEMAALPSPHLLRKSSTFTGLDFAPPRKFKDADTMSDAGSIRSNRSGISAMQQAAIRSGVGRVSRLPGDVVFTQAALTDQLKPAWGMRP